MKYAYVGTKFGMDIKNELLDKNDSINEELNEGEQEMAEMSSWAERNGIKINDSVTRDPNDRGVPVLFKFREIGDQTSIMGSIIDGEDSILERSYHHTSKQANTSKANKRDEPKIKTKNRANRTVNISPPLLDE